ncbi:N-acetylmuramoyl-L-alanine amidase [Loigolactobacillus jiayinensis]|uniref:N-acetylmuramoyl-L-alanine amidase n=1 Tax=Loigolactobacillus jiayinensis TaxID=2486016 RepID=A0ABW1RFG3_9LACO|nr:N-acetylmuramoyl-L-alanine amidase [Loigolactobacillus jiayinensis]
MRLRIVQILILLAVLGVVVIGIKHHSSQQTTAPTKTITISAPALIMRQSPNSSKAVATVKSGAKVGYIAKKKGWDKVTYDGKTGWLPSWLISSDYNATTATNRLAEQTIVIDAGHGGVDSGALATNGTYEKKYTLQMAQALQAQLKASHARIIMTRSSDTTVALASRPKLANRRGASLFISFHFDSSPEANTATGFTTYYYHKASKPFAKALSKSLNSLTLDNRGTAYGNFQVIRDSTMPGVLLEMGYINDYTDYSYISSSSYQQQVAQLVYKGLENYTAN